MLRFLQARATLWLFALVAALASSAPAAAVPEKKPDPKLFRRVLRSSVWVVVLKGPIPARGKFEFGNGTGWILDPKRRLIITNRHVVRDHKRVRVFFPAFIDGQLVADRTYYNNLIPRGGGIPGEVLAGEFKRDLALIRLEAMPAGVLPLPLATRSPRPGQRVYSLGNPGADAHLWRFAPWQILEVMAKTVRSKQDKSTFLLQATVIQTVFLPELPPSGGPGASGGPLVNARGELVGVCQGQTAREGQKSGIFIDVSTVKAFLKDNQALTKSSAPLKTVSRGTKAKRRPRPSPSIERDPAKEKETRAASRLELANILEKAGKKDKARQRYQDIIAEFPDTEAAKTAKERLAKLRP
jgi:S1-C subfamily serine protease